jgi:hypothetical protein
MGAEEFDADLLARLRSVVGPGDVIPTLSRGNPNRIEAIHELGVDVTTQHSLETAGGSSLVPAWMFNDVWDELRRRGSVDRDHMDRLRTTRKIKRSSAVFAILERLPEVTVVARRPLVIGRVK